MLTEEDERSYGSFQKRKYDGNLVLIDDPIVKLLLDEVPKTVKPSILSQKSTINLGIGI
jgi:hypothetical protein